jgi:hypothetical protein
MRITQSFDPAQDRELVERPFDASTLLSIDPEPVERPAERQMGVFRQPLS